MAKKKRRKELRKVSHTDIKQGPIRHQKGLTPLLEEFARVLFTKVGHFIHPTFEQWELGFMRDMHPWREILIWENIARTYDLYLAEHPETTNNEGVVSTIILISAGQVSENEAENEKELRKLYTEAFKKRWLPLIGEPFDFTLDHAVELDYESIVDEWGCGIFPNIRWKIDPRQLLANADIILGRSSTSEKVFCIYGIDRLEDGNIPDGMKALVIRLDPENEKTRELDKICFVVECVKGRHDCQ
jgi:hypothetical protein